MLSEKTHDDMRKLQLIFQALSGSLCILAASVDLGNLGVILAAIVSAFGYFFGQLAESDSTNWKKMVDITPKEDEVLG